MYQKIGIGCSDLSADLEFDLGLLDPTVDLTPAAMIQLMESTQLSLDGTYDDDENSDSDVSMTTDDSNHDWSSSSSGKKRKSTTANGQPKQLPGPKSRRRMEDMTPQEIARRQRRRERNKAAAARCRQRRLDVTNQLLAETQQLEAEGQRLEREIENLRRQRDQLEFVLEAHQPTCLNGAAPVDGMTYEAAVDVGHQAVFSINSVSSSPSPSSSSSPSMMVMQGAAVRPSFLPIAYSNSIQSSTSPAPGFGALFDLESTGLTPVGSAGGLDMFMGAESGYLSPLTLLGSPAFSNL